MLVRKVLPVVLWVSVLTLEPREFSPSSSSVGGLNMGEGGPKLTGLLEVPSEPSGSGVDSGDGRMSLRPEGCEAVRVIGGGLPPAISVKVVVGNCREGARLRDWAGGSDPPRAGGGGVANLGSSGLGRNLPK